MGELRETVCGWPHKDVNACTPCRAMWDPEYTSAKKKTAAEREASRTEFAEPTEEEEEGITNNLTNIFIITSTRDT